MDYNSMEAGRELDIRTAQRGMGFIFDPGHHDETGFWYPPELDEPGSGAEHWPSNRGLQQQTFDALVPRYSTDIAAAWLVVEKLVADGWDVVIASEGIRWGIEVSRVISDTQGSIIGDNKADTLPLAVCRVACYVTDRMAALQPAR